MVDLLFFKWFCFWISIWVSFWVSFLAIDVKWGETSNGPPFGLLFGHPFGPFLAIDVRVGWCIVGAFGPPFQSGHKCCSHICSHVDRRDLSVQLTRCIDIPTQCWWTLSKIQGSNANSRIFYCIGCLQSRRT
jgi:hypothetical protein